MTWLKAKLLLLSVVVVWLILIVLMSPIQMPVTFLAIPIKKMRQYRYGLWIGQDQLVNAIHGGNPDVTISSKVGYMSEQGSKTARAMEIVIDLLFKITTGQENHCKKSIERNERHHVFK